LRSSLVPIAQAGEEKEKKRGGRLWPAVADADDPEKGKKIRVVIYRS